MSVISRCKSINFALAAQLIKCISTSGNLTTFSPDGDFTTTKFVGKNKLYALDNILCELYDIYHDIENKIVNVGCIDVNSLYSYSHNYEAISRAIYHDLNHLVLIVGFTNWLVVRYRMFVLNTKTGLSYSRDIYKTNVGEPRLVCNKLWIHNGYVVICSKKILFIVNQFRTTELSGFNIFDSDLDRFNNRILFSPYDAKSNVLKIGIIDLNSLIVDFIELKNPFSPGYMPLLCVIEWLGRYFAVTHLNECHLYNEDFTYNQRLSHMDGQGIRMNAYGNKLLYYNLNYFMSYDIVKKENTVIGNNPVRYTEWFSKISNKIYVNQGYGEFSVIHINMFKNIEHLLKFFSEKTIFGQWMRSIRVDVNLIKKIIEYL